MQSTAPAEVPAQDRPRGGGSPFARLLAYLPRGNTLDDRAYATRHRLLQWVLLLHLPLLAGIGFALDNPPQVIAVAVLVPAACLVLGHLLTRRRRLAAFFVTGGMVCCSTALVVLTHGSIESHFHYFIIIGFIALYQDWVPFLWNVAFTVLSHGIGTALAGGAIFNHPAAQQNPWLWSFIHGVAVLFACVGVMIFWRITEDEQTEKEELGRQLVTSDAEVGRRQFTADMLVNLARRNQSMLYRQAELIGQLEEKERDPDVLSDLFALDHLATRVRRNAENLLVLAGEQPPRTWSEPVPLRDVVRAAIAETEDLDRVVFAVDDHIAVVGHVVADLTHLIAELVENAVRSSPPDTSVTIRARSDRRAEGGYLLTVEDWGVGMPARELEAANALLATPHEVDLSIARQLGFHVVSRLSSRHGIIVSLGATPGSGVTAVVALPSPLFVRTPGRDAEVEHMAAAVSLDPVGAPQPRRSPEQMSGPVRMPATPQEAGPTSRGPALPDSPLPDSPLPAPAPSDGPATDARVPEPTATGPGPTALPFTEAGYSDSLPSSRPAESWGGWWDPDAQARAAATSPPAAARPAPRPSPSAPRNGTANGSAPHGGGPSGRTGNVRPLTPRNAQSRPPQSRPAQPGGPRDLGRRVPQASLAPELRVSAEAARPPEQDGVGYDGGTAAALSRYQASRRAAEADRNATDRSGR